MSMTEYTQKGVRGPYKEYIVYKQHRIRKWQNMAWYSVMKLQIQVGLISYKTINYNIMRT